jgi:hypothetical protein
MRNRERQLSFLEGALCKWGWDDEEASEMIAPLRLGRARASEISVVVQLVRQCKSRFDEMNGELQRELRAGRIKAAKANKMIRKRRAVLGRLQRSAGADSLSAENFDFDR